MREIAADYGVAHTTLSRHFARPDAKARVRQAGQVLRAQQRAEREAARFAAAQAVRKRRALQAAQPIGAGKESDGQAERPSRDRGLLAEPRRPGGVGGDGTGADAAGSDRPHRRQTRDDSLHGLARPARPARTTQPRRSPQHQRRHRLPSSRRRRRNRRDHRRDRATEQTPGTPPAPGGGPWALCSPVCRPHRVSTPEPGRRLEEPEAPPDSALLRER